MPKERVVWIDVLRGLCLIAILYDHTEIYYFGDNMVPYDFYVPDVLVTFVFLSGVLFNRQPLDWRKKIRSIMRRLVIPYFFFTLLFAIPKAVAHGWKIDFSIIENILLGEASWFITALIVAELLFLLLLQSIKNKAVLAIVSLLIAVASCMIDADEFNFWNWQQAALFMPLLCFGYLMKPLLLDEPVKQPKNSIIFCLFIAILCLKYVNFTLGYRTLIYPLYISQPIIAALNFAISSVFLTYFAQKIAAKNSFNDLHFSLKIAHFIGNRAIPFYFLCGGVPLTVCFALNYFAGLQPTVWLLPIIFVVVLILTTVLAHLFTKYLPYLSGK